MLEKYALQVAVLKSMLENSKKTGFESVTTHALQVTLSRYQKLIDDVEKLESEVKRLKEENWDLKSTVRTLRSN